MPRYRTISCHSCGFMLLKRDFFCERCSSPTRRAKAALIARAAQLAVLLVACTWMYIKIKGLAPH